MRDCGVKRSRFLPRNAHARVYQEPRPGHRRRAQHSSSLPSCGLDNFAILGLEIGARATIQSELNSNVTRDVDQASLRATSLASRSGRTARVRSRACVSHVFTSARSGCWYTAPHPNRPSTHIAARRSARSCLAPAPQRTDLSIHTSAHTRRQRARLATAVSPSSRRVDRAPALAIGSSHACMHSTTFDRPLTAVGDTWDMSLLCARTMHRRHVIQHLMLPTPGRRSPYAIGAVRGRGQRGPNFYSVCIQITYMLPAHS